MPSASPSVVDIWRAAQTTAGPPLDRAGVEKPLPRRLERRLACTASCCACSNLKCLHCLKLIRDWPSSSTSINPSNLLENIPIVPRSADECGGLVRVQFKRTWSVPDYDEPCVRRLLRRYWRHVQSRRPSKSAALRSDRCHLLPSRRSVNKAWASIRHILCGGLQRRKSAHFGTVRSGTPSLACARLHSRVQSWLVAALTSVCDGWPLSRASFLAPTVTALWGGRSRCLTLAELAWLAPTSNSHGS